MGSRILVVDDDAVLRGTVAKVLEDEGYTVVQASNGEDALALIFSAPPDAILLDVLMPRMNGKQVLEALRATEATSEIPVVLMTTVTGVDPGRTPGADDLVEKPFEVDELLDKVALVLFRSRNGADDQAAVPAAAVSSPGLSAESAGVVLLIHRDYELAKQFDERLARDGLTTISMSTLAADDLPRLARVLEPRAVVIAPAAWAPEDLEVLRAARSQPYLDSVPILVLRDDAALSAPLAEMATEILPVDSAAEQIARLLGSRNSS